MDNKAGLKVPWLWTRRQLAEKWNIPPWEVDRVPWFELQIELRLLAIEAEAQKRRAKKAQDRKNRQNKSPRVGRRR